MKIHAKTRKKLWAPSTELEKIINDLWALSSAHREMHRALNSEKVTNDLGTMK
jgi:hypothetical protein